MLLMGDVPSTRYVKSGTYSIAYQMLGEGQVDLVFVPGWVSHVEVGWEDAYLARFLRRLAGFSRLILFDKRGTGLSDRVSVDELPVLEERIDDVRAVMDAVDSERVGTVRRIRGRSDVGAVQRHPPRVDVRPDPLRDVRQGGAGRDQPVGL
jgi:pimeloyl-ACP methyl ester carboxylesterase